MGRLTARLSATVSRSECTAVAPGECIVRIDGFDVQPLTTDRWGDFETVLGASGIGGCWCTYWIHPSSKAWGDGCAGGRAAQNKALFMNIVRGGPPPGLLVYDAGSPIGWCRVTVRSRLPGLANSRHFKTELDTAGVWSLSCFVVRTKYRGRGLTAVLTKAAMEFARENGAETLEVYPTDTEERKSPSVVYTGIASTFRRLGFVEVQRRAPGKPMMRRSLT